MDKSEILRARVAENVKNDFVAICDILQKHPTTQLRELIESFVQSNYNLLHDRIIIDIYRPEGYDYGAWSVIIKLRDPKEMMWLGRPVPFQLPNHKARLFVMEPNYRAVIFRAKASGPTSKDDAELGGQFHEGVWKSNLYSNGCPEDENPCSIDEIREELLTTISQIIERFQGNPA